MMKSIRKALEQLECDQANNNPTTLQNKLIAEHVKSICAAAYTVDDTQALADAIKSVAIELRAKVVIQLKNNCLIGDRPLQNLNHAIHELESKPLKNRDNQYLLNQSCCFTQYHYLPFLTKDQSTMSSSKLNTVVKYVLEVELLLQETDNKRVSSLNSHKLYIKDSLKLIENLYVTTKQGYIGANQKYAFLCSGIKQLEKLQFRSSKESGELKSFINDQCSILSQTEQRIRKDLINKHELVIVHTDRQRFEGDFSFPKNIDFPYDLEAYAKSEDALYAVTPDGCLKMINRTMHTNHNGISMEAVMAGDLHASKDLSCIKINNQSGSFKCANRKSYIFTALLFIRCGVLAMAKQQGRDVKFIYSYISEDTKKDRHANITALFKHITPTNLEYYLENIQELDFEPEKIIAKNEKQFEEIHQQLMGSINNYNESYQELLRSYWLGSWHSSTLNEITQNIFNNPNTYRSYKINPQRIAQLTSFMSKSKDPAEVNFLQSVSDLELALKSWDSFTMRKAPLRWSLGKYSLQKTSFVEAVDWAHFS